MSDVSISGYIHKMDISLPKDISDISMWIYPKIYHGYINRKNGYIEIGYIQNSLDLYRNPIYPWIYLRYIYFDISVKKDLSKIYPLIGYIHLDISMDESDISDISFEIMDIYRYIRRFSWIYP